MAPCKYAMTLAVMNSQLTQADAGEDLISLEDPSEASSSSPKSPVSIVAGGSSIVAIKSEPVRRDSFSGLTSLMKAKKPYTPVTIPSPRQTSYVPDAGELHTCLQEGLCTNYFKANALPAAWSVAAVSFHHRRSLPAQITGRIAVFHRPYL